MTELTQEEQENVRAALRVLRIRHGGFGVLAVAMGASQSHVQKITTGGRIVGAMTAIRVAQVASVPLEDILAGRFPGPTACRHCGYPFDEIPADAEPDDVH